MILVTGGTGLVGSHLLYHLVSSGHKVRAIYRKDSNIYAVRDVFALYTKAIIPLWRKIQWVEADLNDLPALERAFIGVDYVYHAAAMVSFHRKDRTALYKTNVKGTANIVNISIAKGIKRMCFVSSTATLSKEAEKPMLDENSFWNPDADNNHYAITKYGAEMEVWRGTQEGVPAVIINPGVILGPSMAGKSSSTIVKQYTGGMRFYTDGTTGFVDVRDVVKAMQDLMHSDIKNQRFIMVSENLSYKNFTQMLDAELGYETPAKKVNKLMVLSISAITSFLGFLIGKKPKLTRDTATALFKHNYYSNEAIKNAIGFRFTPLKETVEWICRIDGGY